ncbi:MAG: energy transducer TonB [Anaerovibrio sp.]|uniref:energy transducer TonB n=1 Tax=Anaerovibrio sp. TaxID=1872532 RepID=UPI0025D745F6|nr:energy transducer TonB [Anaerovibrio sp.]MCR5176414.1 energy transducer TonB [Anaerovibrio sp.]
MKKKRWNKYFGMALGVHILIFVVLALAGIQWMHGEKEDKPAIEVSFVAESTAQQMAGGSGAAGGGSKQESVGPAIKTASVAAVEKLQTLRGRNADTAEAKPQQEISDAAAEAALEEAVAALDAMEGGSSSGGGTTGSGSGSGTGSGSGAASGNGNGSGGSGTGTSTGLGAGFSPNGDGTYTASSAAGISYQILRDVDVEYPDEARSIGYGDVVEVVARIMVGLDGNVESVTILSDPPNLGFSEAASEALYGMRFAPIYYQGVNIRVPFEKHVIFQP